MGYLYLAVSVLSGNVKGYCGKRISGFTRDLGGAVFANILRMLLCVVIGLLLLLVGGQTSFLLPDTAVLLTAALSGISTSVFVVTWLLSVRRSAYMMLDVFLMMGVTVPLVLCSLLFGETVALHRWIGLAVLLVAVLFMCSYSNTVKTKIDVPSLLLLLVCGVANGLCDFSQKLFVKQAGDVPAAVFNLYTYVFSALVLCVLFLAMRIAGRRKKKAGETDRGAAAQRPLALYAYVGVMSVCLFMNTFFKTLAEKSLDAATLFPLSQGCSLILSSVMAAVLFKERMTLRCAVGILLSFVALMIINLL